MSEKAKNDLLNGLQFLKICVSALFVDEILPAEYAVQALKETFASIPEYLRNYCLNQLSSFKGTLPEDLLREKEIVRNLSSIILSQFEEDENSRVLIFVKQRSTTKRLQEFINHHQIFHPLTNGGEKEIAGYVISAQKKKSHNQTLVEQTRMLERFNSGSLKIMVSTSVIEEGLDVQACNLIIKYNITGSIVSAVQQRGRARAQGSKSILLAVDGSIERRELENRFGELMMNEAIKVIGTHSEQEFAKNCTIQRDIRLGEKTRALLEESKIRDERKRFTIKCSNCEGILGSTDEMRTILRNNFVLCSEKIWSLVTFEPKKKIKSLDEVVVILGDALCIQQPNPRKPQCRCRLGSIVSYAGVQLVQLSTDHVQLIAENDEVYDIRKKKWTKLMKEFWISELSPHDLQRLEKSLPKQMRSQFLIAEENLKETAAAQLRRRLAMVEHDNEPYIEWDAESEEAEDS